MQAIMLGAKLAKRDWRKLCALEKKLEEEYGLDCWDPDDVIEVGVEAERVEPRAAPPSATRKRRASCSSSNQKHRKLAPH